MQTSNRRKRPNRPHISSDIQFSKSAKTKLHEPPVSQRISPSVLQVVLRRLSPAAPSSAKPVSPRLARFGEAVFRQWRKKPQEEKDRKMTFF
jgi:hypothetical protein